MEQSDVRAIAGEELFLKLEQRMMGNVSVSLFLWFLLWSACVLAPEAPAVAIVRALQRD
jgi:hypothetical protein